MTLKYITGRERPHNLDVAAILVDCIINHIGFIKFSSTAATIAPVDLLLLTYLLFIGRL